MKKKSEIVRVDLLDIFPKIPAVDEYHEALGKFLDYFSVIEQALVAVLGNYAKLSTPVTRALFSNSRPDSTMTHIRRVIEVRRLRGHRINELKGILEQIGHINKLRNDLVHLGVQSERTEGGVYQHEKMFITNRLAHSKRVKKKIPISTKTLDYAYRDMFHLSLRLADHIKPKGRPWPSKFIQIMQTQFRRAFPASRPLTWLYKPHIPKSRRRKSHATRPRR